MKAKEAPEKIYLNWTEYPFEEIQVEYTRTDAFIEKACAWLKSKGGFTIGFDGATIRDFLEFIKK